MPLYGSFYIYLFRDPIYITPRFTGEGDALTAGTNVDIATNLDRKYNAKFARVPLVRCKRIVIASFYCIIIIPCLLFFSPHVESL